MKSRGFCCVGLESPKFSENIGGCLRACFCYNADMIAISGNRYSFNQKTDTPKAWKSIPTIHCNSVLDVVPKGSEIVAVDMVKDARELFNFVHPERAFYVFGGEDRTLDDSILKKCKYKVYVPTQTCMNLSSCVNVVLYDRMRKQWNS